MQHLKQQFMPVLKDMIYDGAVVFAHVCTSAWEINSQGI